MRTDFAPWQFLTINNPFNHFAMFGGVATGKTYTGSHFVIKMIRNYPELTGFIGANTYDQLSQATLRELFYWLDEYGFEYVIDKRPPPEWGKPKKRLKKYNNVLSVRYGRHIVTIFTRVLGNENPLRGVEFSWYWLDESRDTPQDTHDVVLSRMRESHISKGIITTTTNGEDWTFERFVRGQDGSVLYGSMHVPTFKSVEAGIITTAYYQTMRRSYSPLMAQQELDALHVNVKGGRAYYTAGEHNKYYVAPWGDAEPNRERPLIVGCDFNFQPAPCIWMVGQVGPEMYGPNGEWWPDHIHWFAEVAESEVSSPQMAQFLINRFPGFFYEIFGDASGNRGTTSNAGEHDYHQIAAVLDEHGYHYTIDVDQANPLVKDRVENMCRLFQNAIGEIRQTYNPNQCPNFDADCRMVGWKKMQVGTGQGRLDDGGDDKRTHATDGGGYAVFKKFPPGRQGSIPIQNASIIRQEYGVDHLFGED